MASGRGGARSGAGRKAGGSNRLTKAVKATLTELAQGYTGEALKVLAEVMKDKGAPPSARVSAANSILDRGHGKPVQAIVTPDGDDAPPLNINITVRDAKGNVRVTQPERPAGDIPEGT